MRMKLDLLFTLTTHLVKPQPRVREILLSLNDNVAAVRRENVLLTDAEICALESSVGKVISIANDTLKARTSLKGVFLGHQDGLLKLLFISPPPKKKP